MTQCKAPQLHTRLSASKKVTELLIEAVKSGTPVDPDVYRFDCVSTLKEATTQRMADQSELAKQIISTLPAPTQRTLQRIVQSNASTWLTVLPLQADGYDLSATQFRDQLAIRYHHEPAGLPSKCDGCGESFSLQHGLDCKKGGLVMKGHNELRDFDATLANAAWGGVVIEPVLVPENIQQQRPLLQADWMARGVWEGSRVAFFDNRIVDADAPSYSATHLSWEAISKRAVMEKKRKYQSAVEELRASITP